MKNFSPLTSGPLLTVCLLLAGCDFDLPLSGKPDLPIDPKAQGLWERTKSGGGIERLLILPLNGNEYLLAWPRGGEKELYAIAHRFEFSGLSLVQLRWLGTSDGAVPDNNRIYQIAAIEINDTTLSVRLLNPETTGREFTSPAGLADAIESHRNHPALFREALVYIQARQG